MPADSQANLSFLPWVRQGIAGAITTPDTPGVSTQPAVADVAVTLKVNSAPLPTVKVRLRGPADVVGIDSHQVVRTDPRPNTTNFEANYFPAVEFDRADFPWLFTPAKANASTQLRPWLCLVVVRIQDGVQLTSGAGTPLPTLQIAAPAKPFVELPNLKDCALWAHSQAAADNTSDPNAVSAALDGAPQLSLSRLICPRLLEPETDYIACVVPTFELGRKAGLGLTIADSDLTANNALAPAWTLTATAPAQVLLPVYYSWPFRTGAGGDFVSLAKRLHISIPRGLGQRAVDIDHPGFKWREPAPEPATVKVEGALLPLNGVSNPVLWSDSFAQPFETALADIVNQPGLNETIHPDEDPLLAPPLYGRWHAARNTVAVRAPNWFDELNLDPRWRTAAAFGTAVIQEHQEALMASAWEQAAEIREVNQRLRQLQVSMAVGESLHARHLSVFDEEMTLRIAAPVFSRIRMFSPEGSGRTLLAQMSRSSLPVPATRAAMRRIGRQRGPLTRRIVKQGYGRVATQTWVASLNFGNSPAAAPLPTTTQASLPPLPSVESVVTAIWNYSFQIAPDNTPITPLQSVDPLPPAWDYPGHFRAAAAEHLARIRPRLIASFQPHLTMNQTLNIVREQMHPRVALAKLARATISVGNGVLAPTAPGVAAVGTETVMMEPSFTQPMYEPLKEKSQDLLLPGLDKVEADTVLGLRTNRAFVDAYMIGLNFEMARELLWRGFPTDQQGTYFKHFWGSDAGTSTEGDIDDLRQNLSRTLDAPPANAPAEEFVLLMRSGLLRRYPDALIYLTPAVSSTGTPTSADIFPIFNGSLEPDISFFGFPVTPATAIGGAGNPGYFVVIQEHPTGPRFGLDDDPALRERLGNASHLAVGAQPPEGVPLKGHEWGKNSAHMADITRRRPVRITIHASQLVT